jgi:hypothetical protein
MTVKKDFSINIKNLSSRNWELFSSITKRFKRRWIGNLFIKIGVSDVMFTSHLDTATKANTVVNHVFDGKPKKQTVNQY